MTKKLHPWRTIKHPAAFTKWQREQLARSKKFAPKPKDKDIWDSGTLQDAAVIQRNLLKKQADEQEFRRTQGFKVSQFAK